MTIEIITKRLVELDSIQPTVTKNDRKNHSSDGYYITKDGGLNHWSRKDIFCVQFYGIANVFIEPTLRTQVDLWDSVGNTERNELRKELARRALAAVAGETEYIEEQMAFFKSLGFYQISTIKA